MRTVRDDFLRSPLKRRTQLVSRTNFLRSLNCLIGCLATNRIMKTWLFSPIGPECYLTRTPQAC